MTNLLFLIVGNFITCSYARNFTVFDLLRKPLVFNGVRQENFFLINIPKGLPWEDSILSVDSEFYSKLKDVAVKKTQKAADKDNNLVIIDAQALESMVYFEKKLFCQHCQLIYSPWYRFVSEPFEIGKIDVFFDHICGSLLYLLVQNNIDAEIDKKSDREDTILIKSSYRDLEQIIIGKSNGLEKITLLGSTGKSELNFVEKKILLKQDHDSLI